MGGGKEFYMAHREGDRGFIAQRCSNSWGGYMALVEYEGGGRRNFIFILKERDDKGWRKMVDALREAGREGGFVGRNRGGAVQVPSVEMVAVNQSNKRSYREVLQQKEGRSDMPISLRGGTVQRQYGGGSCVVD